MREKRDVFIDLLIFKCPGSGSCAFFNLEQPAGWLDRPGAFTIPLAKLGLARGADR